MSSTNTRLRQLMDEHGHDQSVIADAVGSTQGAISLILLGKTRRSRLLPDIARFYGVSVDWLRGEDVPRRQEGASQGLSAEHNRLLTSFDALPSADRRAFSHIVDSLAALATRPTELPEQRALAVMFRVMLEALPPELTWDDQADLLAKWLPVGLAQLVDILPEDDPAAVLAPALAEQTLGSRS